MSHVYTMRAQLRTKVDLACGFLVRKIRSLETTVHAKADGLCLLSEEEAESMRKVNGG